jgi:hypothetical protein
MVFVDFQLRFILKTFSMLKARRRPMQQQQESTLKGITMASVFLKEELVKKPTWRIDLPL